VSPNISITNNGENGGGGASTAAKFKQQGRYVQKTAAEFELELLVIQPNMAQKPVLRGEVVQKTAAELET